MHKSPENIETVWTLYNDEDGISIIEKPVVQYGDQGSVFIRSVLGIQSRISEIHDSWFRTPEEAINRANADRLATIEKLERAREAHLRNAKRLQEAIDMMHPPYEQEQSCVNLSGVLRQEIVDRDLEVMYNGSTADFGSAQVVGHFHFERISMNKQSEYMERFFDGMAEGLGVSLACARDICHLRQRPQHTPELENTLIRLYEVGTPPNINEFGYKT